MMMMRRRKKIRTLLEGGHYWCLLLLWATASGFASDAASVLIVVNKSDPESISIGEYYAKARGIPKENIIRLNTSTEETITNAQYVESISNPLLKQLLKREWISGVKSTEQDRYGRDRLAVAVHRIRYLVTVRGIPLRIANAPELLESDLAHVPPQFKVNHGSVDAELALLPAPPGLSMTAYLPNPFFEGKPLSDTDANRVIRVSRLDGPTRADVIRLIDRTLEAEKTGLIGRAYIDAGGPHAKGDEWINAAGDLVKSAHFDTEFEATKRPRGFQDRLDAPAIYVGWYQHHAYGPWLQTRWSVPPGAIGYHLHSFSATSVRSNSQAWVGPLVAQGYCATFGNVYEPYLELTARPQLLLKYLLEGQSFGDAMMQSIPALSWQTVAIGDPLYRPFQKSLDAQLESSMDGPLAAYVGLRQLNRLEASGSKEEALAYGRQLFLANPSLAIAYRLARIYQDRGQSKEAIEVLKVIRYISRFSLDELALAQRMADLLHELGESKPAFELYEKLLSMSDLPKDLRIVLLDGGAPVATAAGQVTLASRWSLESQTLRQPPTP